MKFYTDNGRSQVNIDCGTGQWELVRANLEANNNVKLTADITQNSRDAQLVNSVNVTLDLNGKTISGNVDYRMITLWDTAANSKVLTIKGGTLDGSNRSLSNFSGGCIYVGNGGRLDFQSGTIQRFTTTVYNGGAIFVNTGASANMSGGTITNCTTSQSGGAIYSCGTFTLSGGTIQNCTATGGGGGIFVNSGTLNLSGGTISGNTARYGGGVRGTTGTINLSGTKISGNHAKGNGNGVQLDGNQTFNMTGGEISGNSDSSAGCDYGGGGILAWTNAKVNISGGVIKDNTTAGNGGAIHLGQNSIATIIGVSLTGNKSGGVANEVSNGAPSGGIFLNSSGALTLGGAVKVSGNFQSDGTTRSNVYLTSGRVIKVSIASPLASGAEIGVSTKTAPTSSSSVVFTDICSESNKAYFFVDRLSAYTSDAPVYLINYNSSNKLELTGYKLSLDSNGGSYSSQTLYTVEGQNYPSLPVPTKAGMYTPGWYTVDQGSSTTPDDNNKVTSSTQVKFSEEKTIYAWWLEKFTESQNDATGSTESINGQQVTTDDIIYALDKAKGSTIAAVDMSNATGVDSPSEVIDVIHNNPKVTPNTLIYLPVLEEGQSIPADKAQNVVVKQSDGKFKCTDFSVTDGATVKVDHKFSTDVATYNRESSSRWGTVCVPYQLTSDDNIQFYTSGTVYGNQILLSKASTVPAGQPAIYQVKDIDVSGDGGSTSNKQDIVKTDYVKEVVSTVTQSGGGSDILIGGQFTELVIDNAKAADFSGYDIYYYKDNKFYKRTSGQKITIPALRAYILIPTGTNITPASAGPASISATSLDIREK